MAELILTDAEKAANTWLELDDAAVGRLVKRNALGLREHAEEQGRLWFHSASLLLVSLVADSNAEEFTSIFGGFKNPAGYQGDFEITIKRKNKAN